MREVVVLVHGIWMTGAELMLLRLHLRSAGFRVVLFHYHSLLRTPHQNAQRLHHCLDNIDADLVHLVAHSLGGIVVTHLFNDFPLQKPGRVVLIGTPLHGSAVARAYARFWPTRLLLGRSVQQGLLGGAPRWKGQRDLAMIAGNRGVGIGMLTFGALPAPNDGTVAVVETDSPEVSQHLVVPYSHFGMLFARPVAQAVVAFLRTGRFDDAL